MQIYNKAYTRENSLIAMEVWEEHQCHRVKEKLGEAAPQSIYDSYNGVVRVYYQENLSDVWSNIITNKANRDPNFVPDTMRWYGEKLDELEKIWHKQKLSSTQELLDLFDLASWAWVGLSVSYFLPDLKNVPQENQDMGMALRQRSADFLELTDHVIQNTLRDLYPGLVDLVKYISIEEIRNGNIPSEQVLKERQDHYIYYDFKIYTNKDVYEFAKENGIEIKEEVVPEDVKELTGQTAMGGKVTGKVRILSQKSEIPLLQDGEILVTAMTTPDYLPAMNKASAFITDEGGVTCHAAIVAREIGKPCVIGTKIATQVLKDGDMVEVDADNGMVHIINAR
ncbi:MAG: PEP-utilizing enzyme [bacterium]|nr:PEP-utilizing enzyme [bacterium]